jgi:uncharacterized membrane protein
MSTTLVQASLLACAVAAGLSGGATFAFSNFIMRALDRLPPAEAVRAMQAINVTAINPLFMVTLLGTGAAAFALTVAQMLRTGLDHWLLAGTAIYILGVVLVTIAGNVPLNEALAEVSPSASTATTWTAYAKPWTTYNTLRTAAAAAASVTFMLAASR